MSDKVKKDIKSLMEDIKDLEKSIFSIEKKIEVISKVVVKLDDDLSLMSFSDRREIE